jgi:hypothetical protein
MQLTCLNTEQDFIRIGLACCRFTSVCIGYAARVMSSAIAVVQFVCWFWIRLCFSMFHVHKRILFYLNSTKKICVQYVQDATRVHGDPDLQSSY